MYDYAQLWAEGQSDVFANLNNNGNISVSAGDWVLTDEEGNTFLHPSDELGYEVINSPAHLILEMPATNCSMGFNFALGTNGHGDLTNQCLTTDIPRKVLVELPESASECKYPDAESCLHCLTSVTALDKLPIEYLGRTDSSKYYISSTAVTIEEMLNRDRYEWSRMTPFLVDVDDATENQEILNLLNGTSSMSYLNLSGVSRVWLGISDADQGNQADASNDGNWTHIYTGEPLPYHNWLPDTISNNPHLTFDNSQPGTFGGHRYTEYDYAQMIVESVEYRYYDESSQEIVVSPNPEPGTKKNI